MKRIDRQVILLILDRRALEIAYRRGWERAIARALFTFSADGTRWIPVAYSDSDKP